MKWKEDPSKEIQGLGVAKNGVGEDPKAAQLVTANVEAPLDDAAQEEPIYKGLRTSIGQKKPPTTKNDDFLR